MQIPETADPSIDENNTQYPEELLKEQLLVLQECFYNRFGTLLEDKENIFCNEHRERLQELVDEVATIEKFSTHAGERLTIVISSKVYQTDKYVAANIEKLNLHFEKCTLATAEFLGVNELPHVNIIILPGTNSDIVFKRDGNAFRVFSLGDVMDTPNQQKDDTKQIINIYITNYPPMRYFDNPNAYLAVVIHELTHYLVRAINPDIPRILDEAIALWIQIYTVYLNQLKLPPKLTGGIVLGLNEYLYGDYMAFWRGLEIDKTLLRDFSTNQLKKYIDDVTNERNVFPNKWLEEHFTTNFTYLGLEAIEMFLNYIASRPLIGELIITYNIPLSQIAKVKCWEDFVSLIHGYGATQNKLGKRMFQNAAQLIGMNEDELSEQLARYYKINK